MYPLNQPPEIWSGAGCLDTAIVLDTALSMCGELSVHAWGQCGGLDKGQPPH